VRRCSGAGRRPWRGSAETPSRPCDFAYDAKRQHDQTSSTRQRFHDATRVRRAGDSLQRDCCARILRAGCLLRSSPPGAATGTSSRTASYAPPPHTPPPPPPPPPHPPPTPSRMDVAKQACRRLSDTVFVATVGYTRWSGLNRDRPEGGSFAIPTTTNLGECEYDRDYVTGLRARRDKTDRLRLRRSGHLLTPCRPPPSATRRTSVKLRRLDKHPRVHPFRMMSFIRDHPDPRTGIRALSQQDIGDGLIAFRPGADGDGPQRQTSTYPTTWWAWYQRRGDVAGHRSDGAVRRASKPRTHQGTPYLFTIYDAAHRRQLVTRCIVRSTGSRSADGRVPIGTALPVNNQIRPEIQVCLHEMATASNTPLPP